MTKLNKESAAILARVRAAKKNNGNKPKAEPKK